jgi:hypothetical protein
MYEIKVAHRQRMTNNVQESLQMSSSPIVMFALFDVL